MGYTKKKERHIQRAGCPKSNRVSAKDKDIRPETVAYIDETGIDRAISTESAPGRKEESGFQAV